MMKIRFALAALAVAVVSLPQVASAETTVIKKVYRHDGPRAEMRMHRHHHADRVVIVKRRHHHGHWH